jgi:hypothetical protein
MSAKALGWALEQLTRSPTHQIALAYLGDYTHPETGIAFPHQATLAKRCRCCVRTLISVIGELEEDGLLKVLPQRRLHSGRRAGNHYRLLIPEE